MAHSVAPYTRSRNVLYRFTSAVLFGDQVFCGAPQMLGLFQANAVVSREFGRVTFPDGKSAIEAAATLANERLVAEFSKCFWVHGNSLGLTSKSPLTCTRMAGAVVQRIGGAWA